MHSTTARKNVLGKVHELLSEYLGDECPEDENFEDSDPEIDAIRTEISDFLEQETARLANTPSEPSKFVVGIEYKSGFELFATETYRVEAIDWPAAKRAAFALADDSHYSDDRIPDLRRFAIDRTGEEAVHVQCQSHEKP